MSTKRIIEHIRDHHSEESFRYLKDLDTLFPVACTLQLLVVPTGSAHATLSLSIRTKEGVHEAIRGLHEKMHQEGIFLFSHRHSTVGEL